MLLYRFKSNRLATAMSSMLGLSLLFSSTNVLAQAMGLNDQIKAANRAFQDQLNAAQDQVNGANRQMTQCAMQYQKGDDGKAHPDLEDKPESNMVEALLPAITSLAPALPGVLDSLKGADSDAEKSRKSALDDYNSSVADFNKRFNGTVNPAAPGLKDASKAPTSSKVRTQANQACDTIAASASGNPTAQLQYQQCLNGVTNLTSAAQELRNQLDVAAKTNNASGALTTAAIQAAAGGFMSSTQHDQEKKQVAKQNQLTQKAADQGLKLCEMDAQSQIDGAKRALAQITADRADALRDLALRNAAEMNKDKTIGDDAEEKKMPGFNPGTPGKALAKKDAPAAPAKAGGGAPGGAPSAGGGGGADSPTWGFGGGSNGNYLGGGLPNQEGAASFAASGGGGAFSGGFGQEGLDLANGDAGAGSDAGAAERGIASGFGDGGLQVMMARMRIRFAYHAGELMQGVDLKSIAKKNDNAGDQKQPDRLPASKL